MKFQPENKKFIEIHGEQFRSSMCRPSRGSIIDTGPPHNRDLHKVSTYVYIFSSEPSGRKLAEVKERLTESLYKEDGRRRARITDRPLLSLFFFYGIGLGLTKPDDNRFRRRKKKKKKPRSYAFDRRINDGFFFFQTKPNPLPPSSPSHRFARLSTGPHPSETSRNLGRSSKTLGRGFSDRSEEQGTEWKGRQIQI